MSDRITYGVRKPFGLVPATVLTVVCMVFVCIPATTVLGQDISSGSIPEGFISLITRANAAGNLVSTIEKDLSVVKKHPEATPDERYALQNTLELARVELHEAEKSVTDTLSDYYEVDVSTITNMREFGKSWEVIVAGLENEKLFDIPRTHDGTGTDSSSIDGRSEVPPTTIVAENPDGAVLEPHSTKEKEEDSWGYGLDRYEAEDGRNNNSNGSGGAGGGNSGMNNGVGGTSNAGGNSNNNGNNGNNNGVGGGVGGGKDGNRGRGSK